MLSCSESLETQTTVTLLDVGLACAGAALPEEKHGKPSFDILSEKRRLFDEKDKVFKSYYLPSHLLERMKQMRISIHQETVSPMIAWLKEARERGDRNEGKLRAILSMPDYSVEFRRYSEPNLPVCGICFEEAVDFFLHFDEKDFENPRLASKKESFLAFYHDLDSRIQKIQMLENIMPEDLQVVEQLLKNGLPDSLMAEIDHFTVLLTVSIGNSMGWPYGEYIHFDVANLDSLEDKDTFLHVLAHEIHHIMFSRLLPEEMSPRQYFFVNFAFEGLAVHFCNNAATPEKPSKYSGPMLGMDEAGWEFYAQQHTELIQKVLDDGEKSKGLTMEQVDELISGYEQFTFTSLKTGETRTVLQYPTYYAGCCLWGSIDLCLGKERLFEVLTSYDGFLDAWEEARQTLRIAQEEKRVFHTWERKKK